MYLGARQMTISIDSNQPSGVACLSGVMRNGDKEMTAMTKTAASMANEIISNESNRQLGMENNQANRRKLGV